MFHSILVPLDGSPFAEQALPFALGLAGRAGAGLHLVRAHIPLVYATGVVVLDLDADQRVKEREVAYMDGLARALTAMPPHVRVSAEVLDALVAPTLAEQLAALKTDLIVMATHGRGPISRMWLGSTADALVRTASVPLLLIRPSEPATGTSAGAPALRQPSPPFRRMLIALDGSSLAEKALTPALEIGRLMGATCTLLRVVEPVMQVDITPEWSVPAGVDETLTQQLCDQADAYLKEISQRLRGEGVDCQTRVVAHPQPAAAILDEARDQQADLIALATHGRGHLKRFFLGSVADKVVRGASTPVLVYRPPAET
jgi:nucleotide-binding universal stress UspA family protein